MSKLYPSANFWSKVASKVGLDVELLVEGVSLQALKAKAGNNTNKN